MKNKFIKSPWKKATIVLSLLAVAFAGVDASAAKKAAEKINPNDGKLNQAELEVYADFFGAQAKIFEAAMKTEGGADDIAFLKQLKANPKLKEADLKVLLGPVHEVTKDVVTEKATTRTGSITGQAMGFRAGLIARQSLALEPGTVAFLSAAIAICFKKTECIVAGVRAVENVVILAANVVFGAGTFMTWVMSGNPGGAVSGKWVPFFKERRIRFRQMLGPQAAFTNGI